MADNYLEKKMAEYRARSASGTAHRHTTPSLNQLLIGNRSCRGYDSHRLVTRDELLRIIGVNARIASARNQQVLRFRPVTGDEARQLCAHVHMGGALPEEHLPHPGTEPNAFIVVCATIPENKWVDIDLGISAQSMLLKAVEMGLGGLCIGAFDNDAVTDLLHLPSQPLLLLAIGRSIERTRLIEIGADDSHAYYREDGVHMVPKVRVDELIIG